MSTVDDMGVEQVGPLPAEAVLDDAVLDEGLTLADTADEGVEELVGDTRCAVLRRLARPGRRGPPVRPRASVPVVADVGDHLLGQP
ncbi:hypothetical protein ACR9E3_17780 [Actinomycetospora sp. C-140]